MQKRLLITLQIILIQTAVFSQASMPKATPEAEGFSTERLKRLDKNVQHWIDKKWLSGAMVLITRNGKIIYEKGFGYDDVNRKTPMKADLLFRLASQTKAITSVSVMSLYEEGKIQLDEPVYRYIPEFKDAKVLDKFNAADTTYTTVAAKRPITIRDLLTHTSGIGYAQIGSAAANTIYAKNQVTAGIGIAPPLVLGAAIKRLGPLPLMHQPGERFTYGLNTDVLGYLVEVVSGMPLDKFFQSRIFEPLGMNDTYFYLPGEKQSRLSKLSAEDSSGLHPMNDDYAYNGAGMNPNYPNTSGTYFSGGAGLTSTITDYAIFLQMLLNGGTYNGKRILAPNTVRMMTSNQIGDVEFGNDKFGLGFSIATEKTAAKFPVSVGTYGWGGAFGTTYWVDPKEKIVAQFYTQIWGRRHSVEDNFKVLVYQALTK